MTVRVFCPPDSHPHPGDQVVLDEEESHYLIRVRRRHNSDAIEVLDGRSDKWRATIISANPRHVVVQIDQLITEIPLPSKVHLQLGMPESAATLEIVTQACELGAQSIILSHCTRSQGRLPSPERINRAIRAAMRQSGRSSPLTVVGPFEFTDTIRYAEQHSAFFASVAQRRSIETLPATENETYIFVGPEGGLTKDEIDMLISDNYAPLGLGPWILRTQTAAIASLCRFLCSP